MSALGVRIDFAFRVIALQLLLLARPAEAQAPSLRPMTVDDLFTLSALSGVAVSPDGESLAATVIRPGSVSRFGCVLCNYQTAADVWLIDQRTGERRNLTQGTGDASGSWLPTWSLNGRRLALVSTKPERGEPRGGNNARLYLWDAARNTLTRLAEPGVHLQADIHVAGRMSRSIAWLSDTTLLAVLLPAGAHADEQILPWRRGVADATRAWVRWQEGTEPTASVLDSPGSEAQGMPTASLQLIDVVRHTSRTLAEIPNWDLWDLNYSLQVAVSPDQRSAAIVAVTGTVAQRADRRIGNALWTHRVGVVSLVVGAEFIRPAPIRWAKLDRWSEGVEGQFAGWSPDSRAFTVLQQMEPWARPRKRVALVISASDGAVRVATPSDMTVDTTVWTARGKLLAYARPLPVASDPSAPRPPARWDWWRIDESAAPANLTRSLPDPPHRWYPTRAPNRFVGIADGALWAFDGDSETAVALTGAVLPANASIVRSIALPGDSAEAEVLVITRTGSRGIPLSRVTLRALAAGQNPTVTPIAPPSASAVLVDSDPGARTIAWSDDTPGGVFLWATHREGVPVKRLALNEHVAQIAQGRRLLFSYRSVAGDSLQALALLPPSYQEGKRYPVVVWAYGGLVVRDTMNVRIGKNYAGTFNLEVLAGRGYVVLFPSMPLPFGVKSDVRIEMPKGVTAAVDKLIDLGVADPDRLAVAGHSFGGYSTYAIITYTDRFKAAIAMSGHPDLVSLYGQFLPHERYSDRVHMGLTPVLINEYGPFNMGGSPWDDLWRYLRNSPLFYLDRVTTPLMIVHGDMDGAPIQQGEEAFTALHRMGKPAKFVRYWGEGHVVASPVNVRHLWQQIFDWLDKYLGTSAGR
jgi:dipeptidyl aminopeptidase/acylaminoacyl peptidase